MHVIVGISGASGVVLGLHLVRAFKQQGGVHVHLVVSSGARETWRLESPIPLEDLFAAADTCHDEHNLGASIASGSFETAGMVVLPCSMKTLAAIAHGFADTLLVRAADVCLKEGRPVVLCPREMPFGTIHLKNMVAAADAGCVIMPPVLTFYNAPQTLEDQIDHLVGKILMRFGCNHAPFRSWQGTEGGDNA